MIPQIGAMLVKTTRAPSTSQDGTEMSVRHSFHGLVKMGRTLRSLSENLRAARASRHLQVLSVLVAGLVAILALVFPRNLRMAVSMAHKIFHLAPDRPTVQVDDQIVQALSTQARPMRGLMTHHHRHLLQLARLSHRPHYEALLRGKHPIDASLGNSNDQRHQIPSQQHLLPRMELQCTPVVLARLRCSHHRCKRIYLLKAHEMQARLLPRLHPGLVVPSVHLQELRPVLRQVAMAHPPVQLPRLIGQEELIDVRSAISTQPCKVQALLLLQMAKASASEVLLKIGRLAGPCPQV